MPAWARCIARRESVRRPLQVTSRPSMSGLPLLEEFPDLHDHRSTMASHMNSLAVLLREDGKLDAARRMHDLAIEHRLKLLEATPKNRFHAASLLSYYEPWAKPRWCRKTTWPSPIQQPAGSTSSGCCGRLRIGRSIFRPLRDLGQAGSRHFRTIEPSAGKFLCRPGDGAPPRSGPPRLQAGRRARIPRLSPLFTTGPISSSSLRAGIAVHLASVAGCTARSKAPTRRRSHPGQAVATRGLDRQAETVGRFQSNREPGQEPCSRLDGAGFCRPGYSGQGAIRRRRLRLLFRRQLICRRRDSARRADGQRDWHVSAWRAEYERTIMLAKVGCRQNEGLSANAGGRTAQFAATRWTWTLRTRPTRQTRPSGQSQ